MGLEIDFTRVDTYQRSNLRGLSSAGRSRGKVTAIGQVNDAGKEKRVVGVVVKVVKEAAKIIAIDAALTKLKETKAYKKAEQAVTKAYKTAKEKVTNAYKKAKEAIRNTNSRRRSFSSSRRRSFSSSRRRSFSSSRRRSSSSSSGSSSSSSGGGGFWRR